VLVVVQLDAVSVPLVEQLLGEGRLPALAELRARGSWVELETPATHFPAGTYATLYSGLDVGDHGMYYAFQWRPDEQRLRWRESFPNPEQVWERVARAGRRVLVLDPYEAPVPRTQAGILLSGWQFVNVMSLHRWSNPSSAYRELVRTFGRSRRLEEVFGRPTPGSLLALHQLLVGSIDRLVEAAVHLLARERFDLVWLNFLAGHLGGHMLWNLGQLEHEQLDPRTRQTLERGLPDLYERMDHALGRIVAALPDEADLLVTSPMGMGDNMSRVDLLPGMLEAVLSTKGSAPTEQVESRTERFLWWLRASVPAPLRARVAGALHGPLTRQVTMRLSSLGVDWTRTPAFLLPSDHFGQVRLNVKGRERDGIVDPGEVDGLVREIREGLLSFRDPDGEAAVAAVDRTAEVLDGRRVSLLPDLVVRWSERPSAGVTHVTSTRHGAVRRFGTGSGRSGAHLPQAWALVVPGSSTEARSPQPNVRDVAATVCSVLEVEAPDLPGSPLLMPS
jgi:predicted AlkP superfamily phosphohydrolase/phosphomutase